MLNKKDIEQLLKQLNFDPQEYIVISGAAMVIQGIKQETNDIDIVISNQLEATLNKKNYKFHLGDYNNHIYELGRIELFHVFYEETEYIEIDGIRFATLESILKLKQKLNRKKDLIDIKTLDLAICLRDNKKYEKELYKTGIKYICGVDEVGRGPLVGPVVAAAVILPSDFVLEGLTDSKKLSEKKREQFSSIIKERCLSYGIGVISNDVIDEINIYEATKLAMYEAINNLKIIPDHVLIDAMKLDLDIPSTSIIKGDLKSISISAASVIAKVYRDNLMDELDKEYPYYDFKKNKGYPTKKHIEAIKKYGILKEHRHTYGPVSEYINEHKI